MDENGEEWGCGREDVRRISRHCNILNNNKNWQLFGRTMRSSNSLSRSIYVRSSRLYHYSFMAAMITAIESHFLFIFAFADILFMLGIIYSCWCGRACRHQRPATLLSFEFYFFTLLLESCVEAHRSRFAHLAGVTMPPLAIQCHPDVASMK